MTKTTRSKLKFISDKVKQKEKKPFRNQEEINLFKKILALGLAKSQNFYILNDYEHQQ